MNKKKLSIGLLIALAGFPQISETIYTPSLPNVAIGLHTSAQWVEATLSIYFLGFALGVLLWGTISDRIGRRKAMLSGIIIYGIATICCSAVGDVESLLFLRLIQAFGASVGSVITQTILRDAFDGQERTKLFAVMSGALAFSPAIGPLLGGYISEYGGWRANFEVLALFSVILVAWSFIKLPETRPDQVGSKEGSLFRNMLSSSTLWGHVILIGTTNGILFGFYQEAPFVFIEQLGMQPSHYGLFGLLIASATLLSARVSYRLTHRVSTQQFIHAGAYAVVGGSIAFSLMMKSLPGAILPLFVIFLGIGLIVPHSLSSALKPFQSSMGTAGSIFGGCYYLLIAGFTGIMSLLHNGKLYPLPFYMMGLGMLLVVGSRLVASKSESWQLRGDAKPIK